VNQVVFLEERPLKDFRAKKQQNPRKIFHAFMEILHYIYDEFVSSEQYNRPLTLIRRTLSEQEKKNKKKNDIILKDQLKEN